MSKLISVNATRNGTGRTLITSILALKLAENDKKVLLIDNNLQYLDLEKYLLVDSEYSVDDLKPYLESKSLDKTTLKALATKINNNIDIITGSKLNKVKNMLSAEEIKAIKDISDDLYDFIITDARANLLKPENLELIKFVDNYFIVCRNNKTETETLSKQLKTIEATNEEIEELYKKAIIIFNKTNNENINGKDYFEKIFGKNRVFNIEYSQKLDDFCNGYKCELEEENLKTVNRIIEMISDIKILEKSKKESFFAKLPSLKKGVGKFGNN